MDSAGKAQKGRGKMGEANYEEAMKEALSEIFQNLKEIEKDSKMKRMKMDLDRRRGNAPAETLRETTAEFKKPKEIRTRRISAPLPPKSNLSNKSTRELSTPVPPKSSSRTMQWLLPCYEEEEESIMMNGKLIGRIQPLTSLIGNSVKSTRLIL